MCTPGMGVNLWGVSPLYVNPVNGMKILTEVLAEGKGISVRRCLKEAGVQSYELELVLSLPKETETAYKATSKGKVAPHTKAPGSGDRVNAAVV